MKGGRTGGKQKTHSGSKKRIKVKKSGAIHVRKSCKNHLLSNKSKKMKKSYLGGMPVSKSKVQSLRRLMPGKITLRKLSGRPEKATEENRLSDRPEKATEEKKLSGRPEKATEENRRKS